MKTVVWKFRDSSIDAPILRNKGTICYPEAILEQYWRLIANGNNKRVIVFWLNSSNKVIGFEDIPNDKFSFLRLAPREIYRGAIVASCNSIFIVRVVDRAKLEFARSDLNLAKRIKESGRLFDIPILDYLIVDTVNCKHRSMMENELI